MTNQATAGTSACDYKLWDILVESAKERTTIRYSKLAWQAGLEQCQDELRAPCCNAFACTAPRTTSPSSLRHRDG